MKKHFTIIELLIAIAVLVILLSLLQPSLRNAIENANLVSCQTKLKAISTGFMVFSEDMDGSLPGTVRDNWNPDLQKRSWIGTETGMRDGLNYQKMRGTRNIGTIWPYLSDKSNSEDFYRCPSLELGQWGSGVGSNGLFDYVSLNAFSGAKVHLMPQHVYFGQANSDTSYVPPIEEMDQVLPPLISEESPMFWINRNFEAGHGGGDMFDNRHFNGINVASIDGSVNWVEFVYRGPRAFEWRARSPKGNIVGIANGQWGDWNNR